MKKTLLTILTVFVVAVSVYAASTIGIGKTAPDFTLKDSKGKTHSLSDFRGKYVVLEWINFGCPFVKKHYDGKNMQGIQKDLTKKENQCIVFLMHAN